MNQFKSKNLNHYFINIRNQYQEEDNPVNYPSEIYSSLQNNKIYSAEQSQQKYNLNSSLEDSLQNSINQNTIKSNSIENLENSFDSSMLSEIHIPNITIQEQNIKPKINNILVSKSEIQLKLITSERSEQTLKIINKNNFRINLKIYFREQIDGININAPVYINSLHSHQIQFHIGQIQQIGDVFNSVMIEATAKQYKQVMEIPFTIRYQTPKLKIQYQGANQLLSFKSHKFIHIKLKENIFKQYSFTLSSSDKIELTLQTSTKDGSIFPDELTLMDNEKRKINLRAKQKVMCLIAKVKKTNLAFVFKISVF